MSKIKLSRDYIIRRARALSIQASDAQKDFDATWARRDFSDRGSWMQARIIEHRSKDQRALNKIKQRYAKFKNEYPEYFI